MAQKYKSTTKIQSYKSTTRLQKYKSTTKLQKYRTGACRYGGDWTEDGLDLLVAALGPNLTSLALHYVEGMDMGALAHISNCCQSLVMLKLGALVGRTEVVEESDMEQAGRTGEVEVGRSQGSVALGLD